MTHNRSDVRRLALRRGFQCGAIQHNFVGLNPYIYAHLDATAAPTLRSTICCTKHASAQQQLAVEEKMGEWEGAGEGGSFLVPQC